MASRPDGSSRSNYTSFRDMPPSTTTPQPPGPQGRVGAQRGIRKVPSSKTGEGASHIGPKTIKETSTAASPAKKGWYDSFKAGFSRLTCHIHINLFGKPKMTAQTVREDAQAAKTHLAEKMNDICQDPETTPSLKIAMMVDNHASVAHSLPRDSKLLTINFTPKQAQALQTRVNELFAKRPEELSPGEMLEVGEILCNPDQILVADFRPGHKPNLFSDAQWTKILQGCRNLRYLTAQEVPLSGRGAEIASIVGQNLLLTGINLRDTGLNKDELLQIAKSSRGYLQNVVLDSAEKVRYPEGDMLPAPKATREEYQAITNTFRTRNRGVEISNVVMPGSMWTT